MRRVADKLHRRLPKQQAGATAIGLIMLAVFIGLFAFGAIRLVPVYLNYMKIIGVIDGAREEFDGQNATRAMVRSYVSRRFDVESVGIITYRDITITNVDGGYEIAAVYDHTAPFIGNISFTVHFNKTELVRR